MHINYLAPVYSAVCVCICTHTHPSTKTCVADWSGGGSLDTQKLTVCPPAHSALHHCGQQRKEELCAHLLTSFPQLQRMDWPWIYNCMSAQTHSYQKSHTVTYSTCSHAQTLLSISHLHAANSCALCKVIVYLIIIWWMSTYNCHGCVCVFVYVSTNRASGS